MGDTSSSLRVPTTFVCNCRLDEVSKEKKRCIETAHEACLIVCNVVAPKDGDELLWSLVSLDSRHENPTSLEWLISAHKEAPTSHVKTQIMSWYGNWYPVKTLMKLHKKYERITKWQVRKSKEHAENVCPGIPLEKVTRHCLHIDVNKMGNFLDFINCPYT